MPTEFQKVMDKLFAKLREVFVFIDDILIVIRVKKDRSREIALDARALNQEIDKDKYQMPNLDNLLRMVAEKLDTEKGEAWFSSVDMTYEYG